MKFKTIFILFNIVLLVTFFFIAFFPIMLLGPDYGESFMGGGIVLVIAFFLIIAGFNTYFILNWKLFTLLEKEDWPQLLAFLKQRVIDQKKYRRLDIKLLFSSAVITSNVDVIEKLREQLLAQNPEKALKYAVNLGIPFIVKNQKTAAIDYYKEMSLKDKSKDSGWLKWILSFCYLMDDQKEPVPALLKSVLNDKKSDPVLVLLSLYLLVPYTQDNQETSFLIEEKRNIFLKKFPTKERIQNQIARVREELIFLTLMNRLIDDSLSWIYTQVPKRDVK